MPRPPLAHDRLVAPAGEAWSAASRTAMRAGMQWVRATLRGDDHVAARRAFEESRMAAARAGVPTALDAMVNVLGLAPADEDCLLFALAHRIDGGLAALCAEAVGDPRQSYVTAHLLTLAVGGGDPAFGEEMVCRLTLEAPLRRYALVDIRETHALAAIAIEEAVALRLLGIAPAGTERPGLVAVPPAPRLERLQRIAHDLGDRLRRGPTRGLALVGPRGSGRLALARSAAEAAGLAARSLDTVAVPASPEARAAFLRAVSRDARLDGLAVVIDADPEGGVRGAAAADAAAMEIPGAGFGRGLVREMAQALDTALIVIAREPTGLPPGMAIQRMQPLEAADREALWSAAIAPTTPERMTEARLVARHFPLGPHEIADIAATLDERDPAGALWHRCRTRGGRGLESLAEHVTPRFSWDDLILPDSILTELRAIADQVRHRATVYDRWGFSQRLSGGRGITALFAGPSGVGKTMAAEVIAGELGLDLYRVDLSRLVSKYIGETEKNLRRVFDAAEETGACLFLDEADACLGKRSEVKDSHDRHANMEVSYLLQRMESYAGLCLLATNLKNNLDGAFLRRLRFVVDIPFPDQGVRRRIWERAFPPGAPIEDLDFAALARLDITGGSIVVIAVNAAFLAAADDGPVTMERIGRAARGEFRKHDKTFRATW